MHSTLAAQLYSILHAATVKYQWRSGCYIMEQLLINSYSKILEVRHCMVQLSMDIS